MLRQAVAAGRRGRSAASVGLSRAACPSRGCAGYSQLTDADVTFFRSVLGDGGVVTDSDAMESYNTDWMRKYHGASRLALRPASTEEVSQVLKHCHERRLAVVPQGGNTGLVGGSVPVGDEVVLSLSRMSRIRGFDAVSGALQCDAGCVLERLDAFAEEHGCIMPLDLGAKGTCQIGGNVSTSAGGLRFIRYGSLHGSVLGLEVVLADGTVLDLMSDVRKDNTGYDLKQLFIGAEGTLGVVTGVSILTAQRPTASSLLMLACPSYEAVNRTFVSAKSALGTILTAFEFMDGPTMDLSARSLGQDTPLGEPYPHYVLIETGGANAERDQEAVDAFLEAAMESGDVLDGTASDSPSHMARLWELREGASSALAVLGNVPHKYDVSLPLPHMYALVEEMRERFSGRDDVSVIGYGHLGDSNIHLNVGAPADAPGVLDTIEPFVYDFVAKHRGSISAEHGIGVAKQQYLHLSKSAPAIALMRQIKGVFDPQGILNPGKVLPAEE